MRKLTALLTCLVLLAIGNAQKPEKITDPKIIQELLTATGIDSTTFLKDAGEQACDCIDSVDKAEKDPKLMIEGFSVCIEKQVISYQLTLKMWRSMRYGGEYSNISLQTNKESQEYRHYYYQIESLLIDSCKILKKAISSNDVANDKSYSDDPDARSAYDKGVKLMREEKYAESIPYFKSAVEIDDQFVFAWDNLGICYRRTQQLDKAEAAYKSSLKVDPSGRSALQNLAVVYQYQNKFNEAIDTYLELAKYYPEDPEVHYGLGMIYFDKKDFEKIAR